MRLVACISSHGFGHFAMTAPILNRLNQEGLISLVVRCALPEALIRSRISGDFEIVSESSDFGMVMNSSLDVDLSKTAATYAKLHGDFSQAVAEEKSKLLTLQPDLILANIPYITIAAAKQAGISVVAYCSLNWAAIFHGYFMQRLPGAEKIFNEMNAAYDSADCFICPTPSMAMPGLSNIKYVGPVARVVASQRQRLNAKFAFAACERLVLITPGGVHTEVPVNDWPKLPGITWITAWPYKTCRDDIISIEAIDFSFAELLASCDAVISKPGYGTVTETVCNGIPALYVLRGDWPEEPALENWWCKYGTVKKMSRDDFFSGNVSESLLELWSLPRAPTVEASGISEIVSILSGYLR